MIEIRCKREEEILDIKEDTDLLLLPASSTVNAQGEILGLPLKGWLDQYVGIRNRLAQSMIKTVTRRINLGKWQGSLFIQHGIFRIYGHYYIVEEFPKKRIGLFQVSEFPGYEDNIVNWSIQALRDMAKLNPKWRIDLLAPENRNLSILPDNVFCWRVI